MSSFERYAAQRLVDQAHAVGVDVPSALSDIVMCGSDGSFAARWWAENHPEDGDRVPCCFGAIDGQDRCTCWRAVYAAEQAEPRPPASADQLHAMPRMCGDCAFRKDSPERANTWEDEALFDLTVSGQPFWCHQGMRRPAYWEHPDGRRVEGDPADWKPPVLAGIPFQADGSPGLLCAGWVARAARARQDTP